MALGLGDGAWRRGPDPGAPVPRPDSGLALQAMINFFLDSAVAGPTAHRGVRRKDGHGKD